MRRRLRSSRRAAVARSALLLACAALLAGAACSGTADDGPGDREADSSDETARDGTTDTADDGPGDRVVSVGFYAFFDPLSHSADADPDSEGFNTHLGYEADLLDAVEAMDGLGLTFERRAIGQWTGIWLKPATDDFDLVGGGITILESRTLDESGTTAVAFTDGHVDFRQSLLVRADDAPRLPDHDALGADDVVGALPNTTGEARLLQLIGVADADGGLAAGTRVQTPAGLIEVALDGALTIDASDASPELEGRTRLTPADPARPEVLYLGDDPDAPVGEDALLSALRDGTIDAIARGMVGNAQAAAASGGELAVTAIDEAPEHGGFAVAADDADLLERMNTAVAWLTDKGSIGFSDWLADPEVFMERATQWSPA